MDESRFVPAELQDIKAFVFLAHGYAHHIEFVVFVGLFFFCFVAWQTIAGFC